MILLMKKVKMILYSDLLSGKNNLSLKKRPNLIKK